MRAGRGAEKPVSIPHRYAKNTVEVREDEERPWFQFLIGTLKTEATAIFFSNHVAVSIPHRYAKNPNSTM